MKKIILLLMVGILSICLIGCGAKSNTEKTDNNSGKEAGVSKEEAGISKEEEASVFNGDAVIEAENYEDAGVYLSWYDEEDNLLIGYLPPELQTEYNYPAGTRVHIEAVKDGSVKTAEGRKAYSITSIEYLDEIDFSTAGEEIADEDNYMLDIEGIVYVEEQSEINGQTYLTFGFDFDPQTTYYGLIRDPKDDMVGENYYFYCTFNSNDLVDGKQYCEIVGWEEYSYEIDYNIADNDNPTAGGSSGAYQMGPDDLDVDDYDAAYYSEDYDMWIIATTTTNGKPFKVTGIDYFYIEDGSIYFMGEITNYGNKDYEIYLNLDLHNHLCFNIKKYEYGKVFLVNDSYEWERKIASDNIGTYLSSQEYKRGEPDGLVFKIPANTTAKFTFSARNDNTGGNKCKSLIFDNLNIRDVKQNIHHLHITVKDYK